jgi:cytochrome b561
MLIKNSGSHFGVVAILFHWVMAILIIALLILGLYMVRVPISLEKLKLYGWHKEYGMLALLLVVARSIWRVSNLIPLLTLPWWEKLAARTVHYTFYGFMFAMPLTGWIITSSSGLPVSFFGLFVFPDLISPNTDTMQLFQQIHKWLGYGLIATIVLHSAAALKHHFINKDDILRRMLY